MTRRPTSSRASRQAPHDPQAAPPRADRGRGRGARLAAGLVLFAMRDTIVFFYGPTEIAEKGVAPGTRLRLGGLVEAGSVAARRRPARQLRRHRQQDRRSRSSYGGLLPDLFREGQGVVAEGVLRGGRAASGRHACSPSTTRPTCRARSPTR